MGAAGSGAAPSDGGEPDVSAAGASGAGHGPTEVDAGDAGEDSGQDAAAASASVALVRCQSYGTSVVAGALRQAFDLIGGIDTLVGGKTVTVKVNLTGDHFQRLFERSPGESYVTHGSTALALAGLLFERGARRVRFVESASFDARLEEVVVAAGWDVAALAATGDVGFENTRNLGASASYARVLVPEGRLLYQYFEVNRAYVDTDILISLAKLKQHAIAGVTLATKNLFGITPTALYSNQAAAGEAALGHRLVMHSRAEQPELALPGELPGFLQHDPGYRVPRIIADLLAARPVDLAIVDGITSMRGGEGPWQPDLGFVEPGVLVVGKNAVSTDAVAAQVMGVDPLAEGASAFVAGDNHLLLAQRAGLGTADPSQIEVRGLSVVEARYVF
ncbi:MAG TPA: DUF362 domain-containing protein [Polyangiaceae bacterium]|nr:DUF362 domain-containing protein [Polyangiaceae bacterium]